MADKKKIVAFYVDGATRDHLSVIRERRGMPRTTVLARLLHWFVQQDDYIVTLVMRSLSDESMAEAAKSRSKSRK